MTRPCGWVGPLSALALAGCMLDLNGLERRDAAGLPDSGGGRDAGAFDAAGVDAAGFDAGPGLDAAGVDAGDRPDAGGGERDGGPRPCELWTSRVLMPCMLPAAAPIVSLDGALNTSTGMFTGGGGARVLGTMTSVGGVDVLLISAVDFEVPSGGTLRVTGSRPLAVAASHEIHIRGTLDLTSYTFSDRGAGSGVGACGNGIVGSSGSSGTGGGGGGALGGNGGRGGEGNGNPSGGEMTEPGGNGGTMQPIPTTVRGGCIGGDSGMGVGGPSAVGRGGPGGGGVLLSARDLVAVEGQILAGGAGGEGAPNATAAGGGGGGSGGVVILEAGTIEVDGLIAANGGGGGGGGAFSSAGMSGEDGQPSATRADGGDAGSGGSSGARGGAGSMRDGESRMPPTPVGGGGGGGGAVGYVQLWTTSMTIGGTISPSPS